MEVYRRSSWLLLLLGLSLLATTLQGVQGEVESEGPSESECRPYIEKALKELETGEPETGSSETGEVSSEDIPTVEITTDEFDHQDGERNNNTNADQTTTETVEENVSEQISEPEKTEDKIVEAINEDKSSEVKSGKGQPSVKEGQDNTSDETDAKLESLEKKEEEVEKGGSIENHADSSEDTEQVEKVFDETHGESNEEPEDKEQSDSKEQVENKEELVESREEQAESNEEQLQIVEDETNEVEQTESKEEQVESEEGGEKTNEEVENKDEQESTAELAENEGDHAESEEQTESEEQGKSEDEQIDNKEELEENVRSEEAPAEPIEERKEIREDSQEEQGKTMEEQQEIKEDLQEAETEEKPPYIKEQTDENEGDKSESEEIQPTKKDDSAEDGKELEDEATVEEKKYDTTSGKEGDMGDNKQDDDDANGTDQLSKEEDISNTKNKILEKRETQEKDDRDEEITLKADETKDESDNNETGSEKNYNEIDEKSETKNERSSEEGEDVPEEDLTLDVEVPSELRPRDHVEQLLKLDDESLETENIINRVSEITLRDLKKLYENAIKPLEVLYKYRDLSNRHFGDAEIFSKPLVLFMGPWSGGKSSIINYLVNNEYNETSLRTGAEPSPAYFNILMYGDEPEIVDGTELAADFTFSGLQKFGQGLEERLQGVKLPTKLLEKVNIVEIPGILEVRKQVSRVFPFNDACQWFIDRADIIFLIYDPSKLDVGPETEAILDQLKGREHQTRIILNKADQVKPEELMRVQGALIWNISPLMSSPQPPVMYTTSLWSRPYEPWAPVRLLQAQERAFLRDLRSAIEKRIDNKIASARRFAVRVRNHAKMVDCYLTTYYNHKSVFGNRKQVADEIIEHPQDYHIYEGLSTLTNISRYDLPDPDVYKDFFKLNPLYEFQQLSATCTYFRGCPINRLDIAIAYDLPELVGIHKRRVENALAEAAAQPTAAPGS